MDLIKLEGHCSGSSSNMTEVLINRRNLDRDPHAGSTP